MWNNLIGAHIRRSNRNLLLFNGLLLGGLCALALFNARYLYNAFLGPFSVDAKHLLGQPDPQNGLEYYLSFKGISLVPTETQEETTTTDHGAVVGRSITARFYLVPLENQQLLVQGPPDLPAGPKKTVDFTGYLTTLSNSDQAIVHRQVQKEFGNRLALLPFNVNMGEFRTPAIVGVVICVPLYGLAILNLTRATLRLGKPEKHPIGRALRRYGDPTEVAEGIDAQHQNEKRLKLGNISVLPSWVLRQRAFGLDVVHSSDLVWGFKKSTKHYTNGVYTGTSHAAVLCTRHGLRLEVSTGEPSVLTLLQAVYERAPWMIVGYDKTVEQLWKSRRPALVAQVDERMTQIMNAVKQAQSGPPA